MEYLELSGHGKDNQLIVKDNGQTSAQQIL